MLSVPHPDSFLPPQHAPAHFQLPGSAPACLRAFPEPWAFLRHKGRARRKEWGIHIPENPQPRTDETVCLVTQLCLTLSDPMNCSPPGCSLHGDSPGQNTGVGCHDFLQGIFPTQGWNPGLLHCGRYFTI